MRRLHRPRGAGNRQPADFLPDKVEHMEVNSLQDLGNILKNARKERRLSLEDVAMQIKVPIKILQGLEEAQTEALPQAVFAKSFARSYLRYLELESPEMQSLVEASFPPSDLANIKLDLSAEARENAVGLTVGSGGKVLAVILVLVVLGCAGTGVYMLYQRYGADLISSVSGLFEPVRSETAQQPERVSAQTQQSTVTVTHQEPAVQSPVAAPLSATATPSAEAPASDTAISEEVDATPSAPTQDYIPEGSVLAPSVNGQTASLSSVNVTGTTVIQSNARPDGPLQAAWHRLIIVADGDCWVYADYDGGSNKNFTLRHGQNFVLDFKDSLTLTLGRGSSVKVYYDGKTIPISGNGVVRDIVLPPR